MDFTDRLAGLQDVYRQFAEETAEFRQAAVCKPGCAYCCTEMGTVDITTLEGLLIRERLGKLKRPVIAKVTKHLNRDIRKKEQGEKNRCPFLQKNDRCQIYDVRPFSCRQLYSLKKCGAQGPTVHRQAVELAQSAIKAIQAIDDTGYSGHLSYVLHMLGSDKFLSVYEAGEYKPEEIMAFGKSHNIVINRVVGRNSR
jgi:Fe-S-cluster containining protein